MRLPLCLIALLAVSAGQAQTLKVIYNFGTNPGDPVYAREISMIAQGRDGAFYGTSQQGGLSNVGCVYRVTLDGRLTLLHSFVTATDGAGPQGGVSAGSDGNLYGACFSGGRYGVGTIWKVTPTGTFTVLHVLEPDFGSFPISAPVQGTDGNFYGVTDYVDNFQIGEFYKITPSGTYTPLYNFKTAVATAGTMASAVSRGTDGNFYGTTFKGGKNYGAVFKATPAGAVTGLHVFDGTTGSVAYNVMQSADGNLYGTCANGGPMNYGCLYKLTQTGAYTVLHNFTGPDGAVPVAGLVQGKDGYLYGATKAGGSTNRGVIFRILPTGKSYQIVWTRNANNMEGVYALSTPIFGTDGILYGTTYMGGTKNLGVFWGLDVTKIPYPVMN
jgi:uncharacterized repeat protein (TIGR03803 family)